LTPAISGRYNLRFVNFAEKHKEQG